MGASLLSRKRDLAYFIHFTISLPMVLMIDLQSLYPPAMVPGFAVALKTWYLNTYKDDFFIHSRPWFTFFILLEALVQVPLMMWAIDALWQNSPQVPVVLLPFAVKYFLTTATCMYEYFHWDVPLQQKIDLTTLYGPYLAIAVFMGVDMYLRLSKIVARDSALNGQGTKTATKKQL